jgi:two-component system sensor histidine kinase CssS
MVWTTSLELFKAFIAALLAGCAIIYGLTRLLVRDIKGIRDGIIAMSRNHYKTRLKTARRDELGELADNIEVMRRRIVENERNRQSVIQGVSHDLKTPIGVIESYAIAVKDGMCDPMEAADITLRQTKRLSDKVTKLIHLTRLGYLNIAQVKAESVRMDELVEELVAERAYQTEARIVRELEPVCFAGDDESWRIAVDNLLDNAVRYAVSLISVTLTEGRLTVFNDGKPLSEPDPAVLFNAYEKSRDGKFGLGLSIVRQTAELFGYRVSAENARGGVLFAIYRPTPEGASPVETDLSPNAVRG